jgi:hypothetical protein
MPCSKFRVVEEAKDLNPFRFILFKYIGATYPKTARNYRYLPLATLTKV